MVTWAPPHPKPRFGRHQRLAAGLRWGVFVFFSNRLGCLGSIVVSLIGSVLLVLLLYSCQGA